MCRLFGCKATSPTNLRFSLAHASNALLRQSGNNPDGWGIGFYPQGEARVIKRPIAADDDTTFIRLSDHAQSDIVIAHVRKASVGSVNHLNCHPFLYHQWIFAHNGTIELIREFRAALIDGLHPALRQNISGTTDSELCLHYFLNVLLRDSGHDLDDPTLPDDAIIQALRTTILDLDRMSQEAGAELISRCNFIVSNGQILAATRRGYPLWYLERRAQGDSAGMQLKSESEDGFDVEEESPPPQRSVLIASEPISGETWVALPQDSIILVSSNATATVHPMGTLDADSVRRLEKAIHIDP